MFFFQLYIKAMNDNGLMFLVKSVVRLRLFGVLPSETVSQKSLRTF